MAFLTDQQFSLVCAVHVDLHGLDVPRLDAGEKWLLYVRDHEGFLLGIDEHKKLKLTPRARRMMEDQDADQP